MIITCYDFIDVAGDFTSTTRDRIRNGTSTYIAELREQTREQLGVIREQRRRGSKYTSDEFFLKKIVKNDDKGCTKNR